MKSINIKTVAAIACECSQATLFMLAVVAISIGYPCLSIAADDCCTIVKVDQVRGLVKAKHKPTGRVKIFNVESKKLLSLLKPGMSYGPTSVGGLNMSIQALDPAWAEDCCNFAPTVRNVPGTDTL